MVDQSFDEEVFDLGKVPMVFVGLGGTGGEIVARLKDLIRQQFPDPKDPAYRFFQFLAIDADGFDKLPKSAQAVLDREEEFCFIGGINVREFVGEAFKNPGSDAGKDVKEWLGSPPSPAVLDVLPRGELSDGAQRVRLAGRTLLYAHKDEVDRKIGRKIDTAVGLDAATGAAGHMSSHRKVHVYIAGGSCGGTGSGIFFDVLHMVARRLLSAAGPAPVISAVLVLPGIHVKRNELIGSRLDEYYGANGWAFWEELKHVLRDEGALNQLAMDFASKGWQGTSGSGVPTGQRPLDWLYMFDHEMPGVGMHPQSDLSSFYAFVAKAMFHHFASMNGHSMQSFTSTLVNPAELKWVRDFERLPKIGCSVGFSEIRFPLREVQTFLSYRFAAKVVNEMLLTAPDAGASEKAKRRLLKQVTGQIVQPLKDRFEAAKSQFWAQFDPGTGAFRGPDGKPDKTTLTADKLKAYASGAEEAAKRAASEMQRYFAGGIERWRTQFEELLSQELAVASDFGGLELTRSAIHLLDTEMEGALATMRDDLAKERANADSLKQELTSIEKDSIIYRLAFPGFLKTQRDRSKEIGQFLGKLKALFESAAAAVENDLLVDLYLHLVGEMGDRLAQVASWDPQSGERGAHRASRQSALDGFEEKVIVPTLEACKRLAQAVSDRELHSMLWAYEGRSVTSQYVPAGVNDIEDFEKLPQVGQAMELALEPGKMAILKDLRASLPFHEIKDGAPEDARKRLLDWSAGHFDRTKLGGVDIFALIDASRKREELVSKVQATCQVPLPLLSSIDEKEKENQINSLLSPSNRQAKALLTGYDAAHLVENSTGGVYLVRFMYLVSLRRVKGFEVLRGHYLRRDRGANFPHLSVRFDASGVPGSEASYEPALGTYYRARAVDWWLSLSPEHSTERATRMTKLGLNEDLTSMAPFGFTVLATQNDGGFAEKKTWVGNLLRESKEGWRVERQVDLAPENDATGLVQAYVTNSSIWENHQQVLQRVQNEASDTLQTLCTEWLEKKLEPAFEKLKARVQSNHPAETERALYRWYSLMLALVRRDLGKTGGASAGRTDLIV